MSNLNGYKLMWMMVMFDLPTETKRQRKSASRFRTFLQKLGFERVQFSVYMQPTGTLENSQKFINMIVDNCPDVGDVNILFLTDKQLSKIIHISNRESSPLDSLPDQFELF